MNFKSIIKGILIFIVIFNTSGFLFSYNEIDLSYTINPDDNSISITGRGLSKCRIAISESEDPDEETYETITKDNSYKLDDGEYYIVIKDNKDNIIPLFNEGTISLTVDKDYLPLYPVDEIIDIEYRYTSIGPSNITISSDNEGVVKVKDNKLYTISVGIANINITSNNMSDSFSIEVTDLYTKPNPDSDEKPILNKLLISDPAEAEKLDEVLRLKIEEAGFGTRAGVVAAARFLALEFPYKLSYFAEGGRLDPVSSVQSDGEGRYYHYGLFLSEDKFDDLGPSLYGRATWGEYFREDNSNDHSKDEYYLNGRYVPGGIGTSLYLSKRPNGLDCSGYVSWCYYNGGFDFGDLGAGSPGTHGMSELGELVFISDELLESDRIKAGDLVGYEGHIGIVIGVDEDHIWIADTLLTGLKVTCYERNEESFEELPKKLFEELHDDPYKETYEEPFEYFILMDDEYKEDGNYTAMWEQ
ncbi:MAG: hypothetical protein Q4D13_04130 [Erysipelotrichaceae bacterium]|nr:hypothetical protein [Erysipelotrichaceae bacterium]